MGLIKAAQVPTAVATFSMSDVEQAAKSMLLKARAQAEAHLAAAREEAEKIKAAAKAEGFEQGRSEGLAQGSEEGFAAGAEQAMSESKAQLTAAVEALTNAMNQIEANRYEIHTTAVNEVVDLAIRIARRVTKRQVLLDPHVLAANLDEVLRMAVSAADVRIAVHPDQRATLEQALPQLQMEFPTLKHVEIVEDASISPGGCRLHTRDGRIDADLDGQLDRIVADLMPTATQNAER